MPKSTPACSGSIKVALLRGTASGAPRAVLSLSVPPIFHAYSSRHAVQRRPRLLAFDCPAPSRRVQGACGVAARSACADLGPGAHLPGFALRGGRDEAVKRDFPDLAIHDRPGQRLSAQSRAVSWCDDGNRSLRSSREELGRAHPLRGGSTSSRWWLATLLEIVLSCFDLLVCGLQSDFTSSGALCCGWLYIPQG